MLRLVFLSLAVCSAVCLSVRVCMSASLYLLLVCDESDDGVRTCVVWLVARVEMMKMYLSAYIY